MLITTTYICNAHTAPAAAWPSDLTPYHHENHPTSHYNSTPALPTNIPSTNEEDEIVEAVSTSRSFSYTYIYTFKSKFAIEHIHA